MTGHGGLFVRRKLTTQLVPLPGLKRGYRPTTDASSAGYVVR